MPQTRQPKKRLGHDEECWSSPVCQKGNAIFRGLWPAVGTCGVSQALHGGRGAEIPIGMFTVWFQAAARGFLGAWFLVDCGRARPDRLVHCFRE